MQTSPQTLTPQPPRALGSISAANVVIGAIIGVGIFFTPSKVAAITGNASLALIAWAIGGFIALCGALTFAQLGRFYTSNGAQYQILRDAYGRLPAFVFVFCNATAIQAGAIGIIAVVCTQNIFGALNIPNPPDWHTAIVSYSLVAGVMVANVIDVKWGAALQNFTVLAKVATLLAVTLLAATYATPRVSAPPPETLSHLSPFAAVLAALVPAFFSYGGWQHALWISGEVGEPRRNLPRAIIGGVVIVVIIYLLANWAYLRLLGVENVAASKTLAADAVSAVYPGFGARAIAAAVAISAFGVLNAQLLSGPRLVYGMARDGQFFSLFAHVHPRFLTPVASILLLGFMGVALLAIAGFDRVDRILTGAVFIDGVFFVLTGMAVFTLRRRGHKPSGLGFPIAPMLFVVGELGVVVGAYLDHDTRIAAFIGLIWIIAAVVIYLVFFRKQPSL